MKTEGHEFTTTIPVWKSRLVPVDINNLTDDQRGALKVTPSNMKVSDYLLTLAHDPESLSYRSPLYNAIMFGKDGLERSERELGAVGASLVNRCIYCMAVHASRFISLSKQADVIDEIFQRGRAARLDDRRKLILDFAAKLSESPVAVTQVDILELVRAGFSTVEIYDLVQSVALFGWANRLMHTLGDPV